MGKKKKFNYYILAVPIAVFLFLVFQFYFLMNNEAAIREVEVFEMPHYHAHFDFKVVLDGEKVDFNKPEYDVANIYMHLHLRNPDGDKIMHIEGMENVTLNLFFESLGMEFNATCFIIDMQSFCNSFDKSVRFFVNGEENFQFDFYEPRDLDRVLIIYGSYSEDEIKGHVNSVTNFACIYSGKCPERIKELPVPEHELIF